MKNSSTIPRWAKWLAGLALMATALTAAGLSLAMNISAGLAVGVAVAIAFGLSDVAKILMPIVANGIGWTRHTKTVYAVASIVSVVCACLYLADQFGEVIAGKEDAASVAQSTDQHIADLRASLDSARTMAAQEAQRGGCGPRCRELSDRASKLETALTDAVRQRQAAKPAEATDGKAVVLADILGASEAETSRKMAIVLIFAALLIGELCAHLAGPAAQLIGSAMQRDATKPDEIATDEIPEEVATVAKPEPAKVSKGGKAYYLQRLERDFPELATRVHRGEISCYKACVLAGIRKAPAKDWAKPEAYGIKAKATA